MKSEFKALRVVRSFVQTIHATPDRVYPLLCPVREREWLEGWDCTVIYSQCGCAEDGCIFVKPSDGEADTVWLITRHDDQQYEIEFSMVTPGIRVGRLKIGIRFAPPQSSHVNITYSFTALSERGNEFVRNYTEHQFQTAMLWWQQAMNHYLETGQMLTSDATTPDAQA